MRDLTETDISLLRQLAMIHDHFENDLDYDFRLLESKFMDIFTYEGTKIDGRNEYDHLIKGDLDEYRKPIEYPTEYEGKPVYGKERWTGDFSECFSPGDLVNAEIAEYFLDVLPPACYSSRFVQCGEPYSHAIDTDGKVKETYATFKAVKGTLSDIDSIGEYCGHCFKGKKEEAK